jgi:hypothetical protein
MAIILDGTTGEQLSGNLTFTGTGQRITGDFSNATISSRVMFQTSTANSSTVVATIPNGTGTISQWQAHTSSDPNNSSTLGIIAVSGADTRLVSGILGTGTYLPLGFWTNNVEQMRIATDGTITGTKGNLQLISGTAVASTSGTSIDFTSIPSWVKRITVMFNGVSLSGTDDLLIQIGDSGGIETTGYSSQGGASGGATQFVVGGSATTTGFLVFNNTTAGSVNFNFPYVLTNFSGNVWIGSYSGNEGTRVIAGGGIKTLSDVLTQVRITRTGTDTFDAGSINILYE